MQKGKYYRMRKELVWGAGILAALLLFSQLWEMKDTADMPQQEEFTSMEYKNCQQSSLSCRIRRAVICVVQQRKA